MRFCLVLFTLLVIHVSASSQLVVNAGKDTSLCTVYSTVILGGNPTSSGGQEPYSYKWSCRFYKNGYWLTEAFFLDDPLLPNPKLKEYFNEPINGTLQFILKVTDSNQLSVIDTVNITISSISYVTTRSLEAHIEPGDSVQIEPANIVNGIPPFNYQWEPAEGLTDASVKDPYAKPLITTFYKVSVTDSIGCKNHEYYPVYVNPTSIIELTSTFNSLVYPNPITPYSMISLKTSFSDNLTIKVFDLNGMIILLDNFCQDYKIGEEIQNSGILIFHILMKNRIVAYGKIINK